MKTKQNILPEETYEQLTALLKKFQTEIEELKVAYILITPISQFVSIQDTEFGATMRMFTNAKAIFNEIKKKLESAFL